MGPKRRYTIRCSFEPIGAEGEYTFKARSSVEAVNQAKTAFIDHCIGAAAVHVPSRSEIQTEVIGVGI